MATRRKLYFCMRLSFGVLPVNRGGHYKNVAGDCRSAHRDSMSPGNVGEIGFRLSYVVP